MTLIKNILTLTFSRGHNYGPQSTNVLANINAEFLNIVEQPDIDKCYEVIKDKIYSPTAKDKLYFYPECTVPRFKVREYWNPKKVSVTIKEDNATHKFISADSKKYIEGTGSFYKARTVIVKEWLEYYKPSFEKYGCTTLLIENWDQDIKDHFNNAEFVYINWVLDTMLSGSSSSHLTGYLTNQGATSFPAGSYDDVYNKSGYYYSENTAFYYIKDEKIATVFENIHIGLDADYYLDEAVNRALQDESTIIDENMYGQLENLLNSSDEANHTMAMEVMANSNVEKSAKYIYKLFRKFNERMIYNSAYGSVNFKSLTETTGLRRYTQFNDDNYIMFMYKYNQLGPDTIFEIREKAQKIANQAITMEFHNLIEKGVINVDFPFIKVIVKGVNDGAGNITIIDQEEENVQALAKAHPEQFNNNYNQSPISPCAAHDMEMENEDTITETEYNGEDTDMEISSVEEVDNRCETAKELFPGTMDELADLTTLSTNDQEILQAAEEYLNEISNNELEDIITQEDVEQVEMQTSEVIKEEVEIFPGIMNELEEISNFKADEEMQEIKTEVIMKEREKSVFEPIAQALKPESDNWWETNETTVSNDEDPFA